MAPFGVTDILAALKWLKEHVWPDLTVPLSGFSRFVCIALGTGVYAVYQNLMNPEIEVLKQAVAALGPVLGFDAAGGLLLYMAVNAAAIVVTAGLLAYPDLRGPPAMLAFEGLCIPVIMQFMLNWGLGGYAQ